LFCFPFLECRRPQHRIVERPLGPVPHGNRLSGAGPLRLDPGRQHPVRRQHQKGLHGRGRRGRQTSQHTFVHRHPTFGEFI